ncbi:tRNA lysidine(34) synthetase TilS [Elizabethkingia sp. JS20170427COW]|nr:tRNA lysidine(34) synthetase TilS [Elizabethkingia sp. JS20170427COW]
MNILTLHSFSQNLEKLCPNLRNKKFLLATSGGADSMVMAYLFLQANLNFEIAHVNYHLRGEASDLDQKIVEDFCQQNHLSFHLYDVSEKDSKPENSIELWARELRYRFFETIKVAQNLDFIATAHHLNDQLETFIINLSKAAGITGLCGIPENENTIIRPLLHYTKQEIYRFAKQEGIAYREDHTNHENIYLRNRIRNLIIPSLERTNPHFWQNFDKSLNYLKQAEDFIQIQVSEILAKISISKDEEYWIINLKTLKAENTFAQYEILKRLGFPSLEEQQKILKAESGKIFKGENIFLIIDREQGILCKKLPEEDFQEIDLELGQALSSPYPVLLSESKNSGYSTCWEIDSSKIKFPLKIRKPKKRDLFQPKGMIGKKLISKFFKDEKISILARQKVWLLVDSQGNILGIIGYRQDGRFLAKKEKIYFHF